MRRKIKTQGGLRIILWFALTEKRKQKQQNKPIKWTNETKLNKNKQTKNIEHIKRALSARLI